MLHSVSSASKACNMRQKYLLLFESSATKFHRIPPTSCIVDNLLCASCDFFICLALPITKESL